MEFNDLIKIAYNWIGPRGAIWNTELPHVVSFASVSDQFENQVTGGLRIFGGSYFMIEKNPI